MALSTNQKIFLQYGAGVAAHGALFWLGAEKLEPSKTANLVNGGTIDVLTYDYDATEVGDSTTDSDASEPTPVYGSVSYKKFVGKIKANGFEKKLNVGNGEWQTMVMDQAKAVIRKNKNHFAPIRMCQCETVFGGTADMSMASYNLKSKYDGGKVVGIADPAIVGKIKDQDGRSVLNVEVTKDWMKSSLVGSIYAIDQLHVDSLVRNKAIATTATCSIATNGVADITGAGLVAGDVALFSKSGVYYTVLATSATAGITQKVATAVSGAKGVNESAVAAMFWMEGENLLGDRSDTCDARDAEKKSIDGIGVASFKKEGNLDSTNYMFMSYIANGWKHPVPHATVAWFKI